MILDEARWTPSPKKFHALFANAVLRNHLNTIMASWNEEITSIVLRLEIGSRTAKTQRFECLEEMTCCRQFNKKYRTCTGFFNTAIQGKTSTSSRRRQFTMKIINIQKLASSQCLSFRDAKHWFTTA